MLHTVSPWAITVQSDIDANPAFFEVNLTACSIAMHNTADAIWIVAQQPKMGRIAFRAAFGMGKIFDTASVRKTESGITVSAATVLGHYKIQLKFSDSKALFQYTTVFTAKEPLLIPFWPRDIVPLTEKGRIENTTATIHVQQTGSRSGQLLFTTTRPQSGTVLYFQNLSALSSYCEDTKTTVAETVGGTWPEIGFKLPVNHQAPILADKAYTISDAFVLMQPEIPQDAFAVAELYLNGLAEIYREMPKPETTYHDWPEISKKGLKELEYNKGCWMYSGGCSYLNAYLCDYKTPPEVMVQLAVLSAMAEYDRWSGGKIAAIDELKSGMQAFYDPKLKTISRWLPALRQELDRSEEQKAPMTMDSWYLHHPLMSLSRLALNGDKQSEKLLLDSVGYAIDVAHHFDYKWPVFYKMDTLEVLKAETAPKMGGEKDVAGSYVHIMVNLYKITNDKKYINEAVKAAKSLEQFGLDIFYQANNTAFSALALLRLFGETADEKFLKISYLCLAGIMKNVQLFESGYGHSKHFPNFFGVYPLNDAPYKAPYEEMEVYAALNDYIKEADAMNAPVLPSVKLLIAEFVKYSINRLPFYYPPLLPQEILAENPKTGELDPNIWIPLEDLYDGWEQNGQVGQEVYGAGVGFGIVPRQYIKLHNEALMLFTDYPIANFRMTANKATFNTLGIEQMPCKAVIISEAKIPESRLTVEYKVKGKYSRVKPISDGNRHVFGIFSDTAIRISWHI